MWREPLTIQMKWYVVTQLLVKREFLEVLENPKFERRVIFVELASSLPPTKLLLLLSTLSSTLQAISDSI